MSLNETTWTEVTDWFDQLIDLEPAERKARLDQAGPSPEIRLWLDRMLEAHDSPETLLIDRTIDAVAAELAGSDGIDLPADWVGQRLGQWRIVDEIQRGGMATVVLAERDDGQYQREVAIKVLHSDRLSHSAHQDSLKREIQLLAGLSAGVSDPGIVHLIDGGISEQGWPYLVMEYVDGEAIGQWCDRHQTTLEKRIELLRQVARALAHAHRRLVVHADVKPSNVLIDKNGRARLVDFGIARLLETDQAANTPPALRCSPAWASPEQLRGEPASVASDVFGLGMLMYRLLTGQRPRQSSQITRLLTGHAIEQMPGAPSERPDACFSPKQLRGDLDAICLKAMAEAPDQRYPSVEAFERDLAAWQQQQPVEARSGGLRYRSGKWFRRYRLPATAAVLAVLALFGGTAVALWQAERAQDEAHRATLQAERAETIKDFLLSMFKAADPWEAGGDELDTREVLRQGARQLESVNDLDTATRVELLTTIANVHTSLGWHEDAQALLDDAIQLVEVHPEISPFLQAGVWFEHAVLDSRQSRFDEEEVALNRAKTLLETAEGPDSELLRLRLEVEFAGLFARQNRAEAAEQAFAQAEQLIAETDAPALEPRRNLNTARAVLAFNQGRLEQAYQYMLNARDLQQQMGNLQQATMVQTLSNLAAVAAQLGRLDEALAHDQRAVEIAREAYPPGHPGVARALYALGDTLRQHGRFDEALVRLDEARELQRDAALDGEGALTDSIRARTLLALGQGQSAATAAAAARSELESRWSPTGRSTIQALEFELTGYAMAGAEADFQRMLTLAEQRLQQVDSPARWQPIAQLLRWRMAWELFKRNDHAASWRWVREARDAPAEVARHPTATLRLDGLELLLAGLSEPPSGVRDGPELIESIQMQLQDPAAHADAQAFALCTLTRSNPIRDNSAAHAETQAELQSKAHSTGLTFEGRQFVECVSLVETE